MTRHPESDPDYTPDAGEPVDVDVAPDVQMTVDLDLDLEPELFDNLRRDAERAGVPVEEHAKQLLANALPGEQSAQPLRMAIVPEPIGYRVKISDESGEHMFVSALYSTKARAELAARLLAGGMKVHRLADRR